MIALGFGLGYFSPGKYLNLKTVSKARASRNNRKNKSKIIYTGKVVSLLFLLSLPYKIGTIDFATTSQNLTK